MFSLLSNYHHRKPFYAAQGADILKQPHEYWLCNGCTKNIAQTRTYKNQSSSVLAYFVGELFANKKLLNNTFPICFSDKENQVLITTNTDIQPINNEFEMLECWNWDFIPWEDHILQLQYENKVLGGTVSIVMKSDLSANSTKCLHCNFEQKILDIKLQRSELWCSK